jgi:hypothetical protein
MTLRWIAERFKMVGKAMENKRILKIVAVATLIFGTLVFLAEEFFISEPDMMSFFIVSAILSPVEFLGYHRPKYNGDSFFMLGLNAAIYAVIFAFVVYSITIVVSDLKSWRKGK